MEKQIASYEQRYTLEERELAKHIISMEKAALNKWFKGDTSGYRALWSKRSFTYFDAVNSHRVEDHDTICRFLDKVDGKLFADSYDFLCPRVQFGKNMAVLTYQLYAKTTLIDMQYNCVEIFQKESDDWHVVHSTWSFICPMDIKFDTVKMMV